MTLTKAEAQKALRVAEKVKNGEDITTEEIQFLFDFTVHVLQDIDERPLTTDEQNRKAVEEAARRGYSGT